VLHTSARGEGRIRAAINRGPHGFILLSFLKLRSSPEYKNRVRDSILPHSATGKAFGRLKLGEWEQKLLTMVPIILRMRGTSSASLRRDSPQPPTPTDRKICNQCILGGW
jgi:hypothetical protein